MTVSRSQPTSPEAPRLLALEAREAALKERIQVLEGALQPIVEVLALEWRFKGAHPHREALLQGAIAALQSKAGT